MDEFDVDDDFDNDWSYEFEKKGVLYPLTLAKNQPALYIVNTSAIISIL